MADIRLKQLSKMFREDIVAVNKLDLHVADGELLVLVGPSGCGKTTTLRLVAGLEDPDGGTISIDGKNMNGVLPKDRNVAMTFQDYALYPHMTARKNLAFPLKTKRTPRAEIEKRVSEIAIQMGIDSLLDRKPGALSGGERQRVALGRAIITNPNCLLLDEPLSNLDAPQRIELREVLKTLHRSNNLTTLHVTHDQEEAMSLAERIAVMKNGEVQQVGTPQEIYETPANLFVASFFASPPMNVIHGRVETGKSRVWFTDDQSIRVALPTSQAVDVHALANHSVVLGIRAEHISHAVETNDSFITMRARVDAVEYLGGQRLVTCRFSANTKVVTSVDGARSVLVGEEIMLMMSPDDLHWFEPGDNGRRIA